MYLKSIEKERKLIVRLDPFGEYLMRELNPDDFFDYIFEFINDKNIKVDTIIWDMMFDGDFSSIYESDILPRKNGYFLDKFRDNGIDIFDELLKRSKKLGIENILSNRVSEVIVEGSDNTIRFNNPDWFIKTWYEYGTSNLANESLRKHKISVIEEVLTKYDFDGIDIDFLRITPYLEPGKQWELRENVTIYLKDLKNTIKNIEIYKNKHISLSIRVPDSIEACNKDGIDIVEICKNKIVDFLTLGSRNIQVNIEEFKKIADGIKLYPCCDLHHCSDGYAYPSLEILRGTFLNWYYQGADGIETFNFRVASDDTIKKYINKYDTSLRFIPCNQKEVYYDLSNIKNIFNKNIILVVERKGGYPWGSGDVYNNQYKQLPCPLKSGHEALIELICPRSFDVLNDNKLTLIFYGVKESDILYTTINGNKLSNPIMNYNYNELQIWSPNEAAESGGFIDILISTNQNPNMNRKLLKVEYNLNGIKLKDGKIKVGVSLSKDINSNYLEPILEKVELSIKGE